MKKEHENLSYGDSFEIHRSKKEINFAFPFDKELTPQQRDEAIDKYYDEEPNRLFEAWIADSRNKDWKGDIEEKKKELFREKLDQMSKTNFVVMTCDPPEKA